MLSHVRVGLVCLFVMGLPANLVVIAAEPLPFLVADDFQDMDLVAWRVEQGRPDPANPLLEPEMPWDAGGVFSHGTVLKDPIDGLYKAWQVSTPLARPLGPGTWTHDRWLTYLESDDGVRWRRPKLDLLPWKGHPRTNLIMELWCSYASVNIDPRRDWPYEMFVFRYPGYPGASGRVKGLPLPEGQQKHPYGLYRFRSKDGKAWQPTAGPVRLNTADSCFIYRLADGSYVSYHKTELPAFPGGVTPFDIADGGVRLIGRRTSADGIRWSDPTRLVMTPDWRDPLDTQFMELCPVKVPGGFVATLTVYHNHTQQIDLQWAASRDGISWWRPDRRAALPNPPLGEYGGGMIWPMRQPVVDGERVYVYYSGNESLHGDLFNTRKSGPRQLKARGERLSRQSSSLPNYGALCRASWKSGRLWALAPAIGGPYVGTATTRRRELAGRQMQVNVVSRGDGRLRAELLDGGTGWPLSMFLTPDTQPVVGGTYFPPRDVEGRPPGFLGVLKQVHELWTTRRKDAVRNAEILTRDVQVAMRPRLVLESDALEASLVTTSVEGLVESHDPTFGGIGFIADRPDGPKFPTPPKLELLQWAAVVAGKTSPPAQTLDHTLTQIANGGIHDQIGGGFHRYSTDREWRVPHFEKMLYDNAQLADLYVAAFARTGSATFREVAEGVFTYVLRDMTDPDGPFYSAQDAETDAIEGKYYVWSASEIDQALGDGSILFRQRFGVVNKPDFEHGNVLFRAMPLDKVVKSAKDGQALAGMKKRLLAIRKKRDAPLRDDKVLTSWNGLMIRSLANGGRVLKRPDYIKAATRAADFLLVHLRDKDKTHLLRTYRKGKSKLNGYLVDYAFLVEGLLALHTATGEKRWLTAARTLTDEQIKLFWDEKRGGFYFTSHDHEKLLARTQNGFDSVLPSGNSTSVRNLVKLARLTDHVAYRDHARKTLAAFVPQMRQHLQRGGLGMTHMALALSEFLVDEPQPKPQPTPKPKSKSDKPGSPPSPKKKASR